MEGNGHGGATVSKFDYSIVNHFKAMDEIGKLCEEEEPQDKILDASEKQRLSSKITFLREWKQYYYKPRVIRINSEIEGPQRNGVIDGVNLPQFSAANIPKMERISTDTRSSGTREDFILYVGGPVWGLDWCPSVQQRSDYQINCEYLAVAAHSPASSYHKIGASLKGRGVVQIWCLLNVNMKVEEPPKLERRGRPKKQVVQKESKGSDSGNTEDSLPLKKPRGRPRKKEIKEPLDDLNRENQLIHAPHGPLDDIVEESPPLKKAIGRPKKRDLKKFLDELNRENEFIQAPAGQLDDGIEKGSPPFKKARGRPRKKDVKEFNRESQFIEAPVGRLDDVRKKELPLLKKSRGRPGKKKDMKEHLYGLDREGQYVLPLAVEFPEESSFPPTAPGATRNTNQSASRKKCDMDVCLGIKTLEQSSNEVFGCCAPTKNKRMKDKARKDKSSVLPTASAATRNTEEPISHKGCDMDIGLESETHKQSSNEVNDILIPTKKKKVKDKARKDKSSAQPTVTGATTETDEQASHEMCGTDVGLETETFKQPTNVVSAKKSGLPTPTKKRKVQNKAMKGNYVDGISQQEVCGRDGMTSSQKVENEGSSGITSSRSHIPEDLALPRVVLCLAHYGKVAWDVKWRPWNVNDMECKHRMGYLAVLLGNGSLEVWEVPSLRTIKLLYSSCKKDGTDPRFMKLEPVFRCSELKCGDRQSIPLTVEWSPTSPHDLILAGCHDGTVALWKFSPSGSCQDTKPLLCFSADTVPIRALAWAPDESDFESGNVIVTAGHGNVRFWDLRDPYRPLWDLNPVRRIIYSLDWLPDPRCILLSFDDGTLKFLSLSKAAYDFPVTGKPFAGTQLQGLHSYICASFPIWSIQASRLTGLVAYCSADGKVLHFQLTSKAVDKDPSRNRTPHFLCGSLTEEDATLTVNTPLPNNPFTLKKTHNEVGDTPRSMRGFSSDNQEKRTTDQTPDHEVLALCYGDDPSLDIVSGDTVTAPKGKTTPTLSKKKKSDPNLAGSNQDDLNNLQKGEKQEEPRKEVDVLPPKIVAMHRVRWNMNKGSESWLCSGGAAGIVRCQKIATPSIGTQARVKK